VSANYESCVCLMARLRQIKFGLIAICCECVKSALNKLVEKKAGESELLNKPEVNRLFVRTSATHANARTGSDREESRASVTTGGFASGTGVCFDRTRDRRASAFDKHVIKRRPAN
jgi:hypothetical protein